MIYVVISSRVFFFNDTATTEIYSLSLHDALPIWTAKVDVLAASPVDVVSVTFGCPAPEEMARLKTAAGEVWVTVTSVDEARRAREAGADGLVVQGVEAGGHRGCFSDETERLGVLPLLQLGREATSAPLGATGGIMTGAGSAALPAARPPGRALGSPFLLGPQAG